MEGYNLTDSKAPVSPVETSSDLDEQIQGQALNKATQPQQEAQEAHEQLDTSTLQKFKRGKPQKMEHLYMLAWIPSWWME